MKLTPWREGSGESDAITRLRDEVDRLFNEAFTMPFGSMRLAAPNVSNGGWKPAMDISETEKELTLRMEVPGIDPKALDISITGNVLTVTGEKKEESERKGENFYHRERRFGMFRRSLELPEGVDPDGITAEYEGGVAIIHVPRKADVKARHVEVRQGSRKS